MTKKASKVTEVVCAVGLLLLTAGPLLSSLAVIQNISGLPFRQAIKIDARKLEKISVKGMVFDAFKYRLPAHLSVPATKTQLAMVFEDGQPLPRFGKSRNECLKRGEGRFLVKNRAVIFSVPDESDALLNGRRYSVEVPYRFRLRNILLFAAGAVFGATILLLTAAGRAILKRLWRNLVALPRLSRSFLDKYFSPYLVVWLAIPSVVMVFCFPPFWKDGDALNQVLAPPSATTILHFSWFYSMLSRLPGYAVDYMLSVVGVVAFPGWKFWEPLPEFSLRHAYALILTQHALLWLVLAHLIRKISTVPLVQLAAVAVCILWAPFYAFAHLMGTESGALLFSLCLVIAALRLLDRVSPANFLIYGVCLFGATACRHIYALLALALPLALVLREYRWASFRSMMPGLLRGLKLAWLTGLVSLAAFVGNSAAKSGLCMAYGLEMRSTLGRVAGTRETLLELPPEEKAYWVNKIKLRLDNNWSRQALDALAHRGQYWDGASAHLMKLMVEQTELRGDQLEAASDHAFREASVAMLLTMPEPLWREIVADTRRVFFDFDAVEFAVSPLSRHQKVEALLDQIDEHNIETRLWGAFGGKPAIDYDHILPDPLPGRAFIRMFAGLQAYHLLGVAVILVAAVTWYRRLVPERAIFALALLLTASVMLLVTNLLICFFDRYAMPIFTLYPVVILILVGELTTSRKGTYEKT